MLAYQVELSIKKIYDGIFKNCSTKYPRNLSTLPQKSVNLFKCPLFTNVLEKSKFYSTNFNCISSFNHFSVRHYSSKSEKNFPRLTRMKIKAFPTTFASFSNFFLTHLVIKPHLDQSFSISQFLLTSKKIASIVSNRIAEGKLDTLDGLVTEDVLEDINKNLSKFSVGQRQDLAVTEDELAYSFLDYISLNVDREKNTKTLEILTIHHAFKGIGSIKKLSENFNPFNMDAMNEQISKNKPRPFILNYRFFRKFESDDASDWIINGIQHESGKSLNITEFF